MVVVTHVVHLQGAPELLGVPFSPLRAGRGSSRKCIARKASRRAIFGEGHGLGPCGGAYLELCAVWTPCGDLGGEGGYVAEGRRGGGILSVDYSLTGIGVGPLQHPLIDPTSPAS